MLVKDIMSTPVISVKEQDTVGKAMEIMKTNDIRHLPIVDSKNKLIGIIAERDILKVFPRKKPLDPFQFNLLSRTPVSAIMSTDLVVICSNETVETVAMKMENRDIGCVPVVDGCKLVGLVTEADIFNTFAKIMGIEKDGLRITIRLKRKAGFLASLVAIFDSNNAIIENLVTFPSEIVVKIKDGADNKKLLGELAINGFEVTHYSKVGKEEPEIENKAHEASEMDALA